MLKFSTTIFMCLACASCASSVTFQQHAKLVSDDESRRQSNYGHLARGVDQGYLLEHDPSAQPITASKVNARSESFFSVAFNRIEGSSICFDKRLSVDHADRLPAQVKALQSDHAFAVQAWPSLDQVPPAWPAAQTATITQQAATQRELKLTGPNAARHPTAEICVPAPTITAQTNFITLAVMQPKSPDQNFVLIWDFAGEKTK